jgi:phage terminase large subunit-like protein
MCVPAAASQESGKEAADLAAEAGLILDDWQEWCLVQAMGTRADGHWAAFEVGLEVCRQNGKNGILEARQLAGLFLIGEPLLIHTAHEFKASSEHFLRIRTLIESQDWLLSKTAAIRTSHGDETVEMRPTPTLIFGSQGRQVRKSVAPRLRFIARSRGSGRAFTCDALFYDEAMILSAEQVGASLPTLSAVPNPQVWYTASAGMQDSTQLDAVRKRGLAGTSSALVWLEWSIDPHNDMCDLMTCTRHDNPADPASWAKANPALGTRISLEHVQREMEGMPAREFARERLGVGDWPPDELGWAVIPEQVWDDCLIEAPPVPSRIAVAADVTPDQSTGALAIAGIIDVPSPAGKIRRTLVEIGQDTGGRQDHRAGTDWMVPRLKELKSRHRVAAVIVDRQSPAAVLMTALEEAGIDVITPATGEVAQAFAQFYAGTAKGSLAHLGQPDLRKAVAGGARREIGDGLYSWTRKATTVDISPLCAATLAAWGAGKYGRPYDVLKSIGGVSDDTPENPGGGYAPEGDPGEP